LFPYFNAYLQSDNKNKEEEEAYIYIERERGPLGSWNIVPMYRGERKQQQKS
jgi:hypothetical protein